MSFRQTLCLRQHFGRHSLCQAAGLLPTRYVYDERVKRRAILDAEHLQHGFFIQGIGSQAIHRFGGNGHQLAGFEGFFCSRKIHTYNIASLEKLPSGFQNIHRALPGD